MRARTRPPGQFQQSRERGIAAALVEAWDEKRQIKHRVPDAVIRQTLAAFQEGRLDAANAQARLGVGRTRLYQLRSAWLAARKDFAAGTSGGAHRKAWPAEISEFLRAFLPDCRPLNFALIADELRVRFGFERSRTAVARHLASHHAALLATPAPKPRGRRRWQCAQIGELWQHDSSIHQWWSGRQRQTLILTEDDHSRKLVGALFVPSDTTWGHFGHFRAAFERYGLPASIYTDALSLFGPSSTEPEVEPRSQFQRALLGLGVNHRVAPDPQAKGKIERRFGHLQNRLGTLLRHAKVRDFQTANALLARFIQDYNASHRVRTTHTTPDQAWRLAQREKRSLLQPTPPRTLLDLHLSICFTRRLGRDHTVELFGRAWPVATCHLKLVTIVLHPGLRFWVLPHLPSAQNPLWPTVLASHTLPKTAVHF
jgi:hypothetical protein